VNLWRFIPAPFGLPKRGRSVVRQAEGILLAAKWDRRGELCRMARGSRGEIPGLGRSGPGVAVADLRRAARCGIVPSGGHGGFDRRVVAARRVAASGPTLADPAVAVPKPGKSQAMTRRSESAETFDVSGYCGLPEHRRGLTLTRVKTYRFHGSVGK
jgi:hypothetical protein